MILLHSITLGIGIIGVSVIIWGVISSAREFIAMEFRASEQKDK